MYPSDMKLLIILALSVLPLAAQKPTKTGPPQMQPCPNANSMYMTIPAGATALTVVCVPIDPATLKIDATGRLTVIGGTVSGPTFVDAEAPAGVLDGFNAIFTFSAAPNPPRSLAVFRNGLRLLQGNDYTIAGAVITFVAGAIPQTGDLLFGDYRK